MSETLLAILLVTSSAKGSNLVYHWPPHPATHPRLARPLPRHDTTCLHADNPWRAAHASSHPQPCEDYEPEEKDYNWRRSNIGRARSMSFTHARSHPSSRRPSPSKDLKESLSLESKNESTIPGEYDEILGYSAEFLAGILCPHSAMCHQKFELVVDELAFIGHPVCAEGDGKWRFPAEKRKATSRGRGSRKGKGQSPQVDETSLAPEATPKETPSASAWLQTFHLVLVLDLPDPSSSASGNISKYFETIYEQIAFTTTAVLYQEQVLYNFVETECDVLGALKDDYIKRGEPFADFIQEALNVSSIAPAMKALYESIKDKTIARLTVREFPLEIQLPPYLDALLHNVDPLEADIDRDNDHEDEFGGPAAWGADMGFAWRLPSLAPWKALLRLDDDESGGYNSELYMKLRGPQMNPEDREIAEQLIRFLEHASVTLSLSDMASLLDWDLEGQVFPTVRWLVRHRRAKIVDVVHSGLKTVFTLPRTLPSPLSDLTAEFARTFNHPAVPPLPQLLSTISASPGAHFYGAAVGTKDMLPLYHDIVLWMLKRDLLITLHLRVRIVATVELKERVRVKRELARARRDRVRSRSRQRMVQEGDSKMRARRDSESKTSEGGPDSSPVEYWMSMSPKSARRQARQMSPSTQTRRRDRSLSLLYGLTEKPGALEEDEDDLLLYDDGVDSIGADEARTQWDEARPSMISDPARATPLERLWLAAMSDGKEAHIAARFERINQYFDGKCSDDEILFRAGVSRKQLREVLHHYEEYLQTFLHPA